MKITEIYISSFGSLTNKKILFSDSLNIIEGENESGKSTLMAFIAFMLYGGQDDIDRIKLSNQRCGGCMTVVSDRYGQLQIQRYASVSGKKYSDSVEVYQLPSMKTVTLKSSVGEYILGINKQFFMSTAFVSQRGASTYNPKGINDSIQNILLSAGENYNTDRALKKLDDTRKFFTLKRGRGGVIAELEDKISRLTTEEKQNQKNILTVNETEEEISCLKATKKKYEGFLSEIFVEKKARIAKRINDSKKEIEDKKKIIKEKNQKLSLLSDGCNKFLQENTRSKLRELDLKCRYEESRLLDIENDISKYKDLRLDDNLNKYTEEKLNSIINFSSNTKQKLKNLKYIAVFFALFSALSALSSVILAIMHTPPFFVMCLVLALLFSCLAFFFLSEKNKHYSTLSKTLAEYGYTASASISEINSDFSSKIETKKETERKLIFLSEKKELYKNESERHTKTTAELCAILSDVLKIEVSIPSDELIDKAEEYINSLFFESDRIKQEILYYSKEIEKLTEFILSKSNDPKNESQLNKKFEAYTDSELDMAMKRITEEINSLSEAIFEKEKNISLLKEHILPEDYYSKNTSETEGKLKNCKEQLEIVKLSEECIRYASENIRSAVTPQLISQGDKLFSLITNNKYNGIGIDEELVPIGINGSSILKKSELSYGTNEAMYLSFRSALLLILCKNELPPMMLDESFAHIDNSRTAECIKTLASSGIQSLIFTCNDREKRILENDLLHFSHISI